MPRTPQPHLPPVARRTGPRPFRRALLIGIVLGSAALVPGCGPTPDTSEPDAVPGVIRTGEQLHTVRPGESWTSIARSYGTTVEALVRLNPRVERERLPVGAELRIPPGKPEVRRIEPAAASER